MKKRLFRVILLLLGLAAITSCVLKKPIKIGLIGPLTGPSSAVGQGIRNGFQMAFDETFRAAGIRGRRIDLIVRDDENSTDKCLAAIKTLESAGCGIILIGTTSEAGKDAVQYANKQGLFVLSPTISDDSLNNLDDFFFRISLSSSKYGENLAEAVRRFGNKKRIALLGDEKNATYKNLIFDSFRKNFVSADREIVYEKSFNSDAPLPYAEIIDGVAAAKADGVLIVAASTETALLCKFFERAGVTSQVYLPPWPLTIDLIKNGGKAVENVITVSVADMEFTAPEAKEFRKQYLEKYSVEPSFTAMFGYEAAAILRQALNNVKTFDPESIKTAFLKIRGFKALQGTINFDDFGDALRPMFYFTIKDGRFMRLE